MQAAAQAADVAAELFAAHGQCPAAEAALFEAEQRFAATVQFLSLARHLASQRAAAAAMAAAAVPAGKPAICGCCGNGRACCCFPARHADPGAWDDSKAGGVLPHQQQPKHQQQSMAAAQVAAAHSQVIGVAGCAAAVPQGPVTATSHGQLRQKAAVMKMR